MGCGTSGDSGIGIQLRIHYIGIQLFSAKRMLAGAPPGREVWGGVGASTEMDYIGIQLLPAEPAFPCSDDNNSQPTTTASQPREDLDCRTSFWRKITESLYNPSPSMPRPRPKPHVPAAPPRASFWRKITESLYKRKRKRKRKRSPGHSTAADQDVPHPKSDDQGRATAADPEVPHP